MLLTPYARETLEQRRRALVDHLDWARDGVKAAIARTSALEADVRETAARIAEIDATLNVREVDI